MDARIQFQSALRDLEQKKASSCCRDLIQLLERLGFEVRDGKRGGHKLFFHSGIAEFRSGSFNCGHGKNPEVKPAYVTKLTRVLRQYEDEIVSFLESRND